MELNLVKCIRLRRTLIRCRLIKREILLWDLRVDKLGCIIRLGQMQTVNIQALEIRFCTYKAQKMENGC